MNKTFANRMLIRICFAAIGSIVLSAINVPISQAAAIAHEISARADSTGPTAEVHSTSIAVAGGSFLTQTLIVNVGDTVTVNTLASQSDWNFDSATVESISAINFNQVDATAPCAATTTISNGGLCLFEGIATAALNPTSLTISFIQSTPGGPFVVTTTFSLQIIDPNAPAQSSSSSNSDAAALAAAEAKRKAEIVAAKSSLLADIKAIKSPTLAEYRAADYGVTQQATVDRINTQVLELQAKTPTIALTEAQILPVVQKESFVEYVSTDVTQGRVNSRQLIDNSIITSDYKFRASVLRAIKNASVADLNTYAKIKAVADAEIASIQARKDRLEAIIKKISGLK